MVDLVTELSSENGQPTAARTIISRMKAKQFTTLLAAVFGLGFLGLELSLAAPSTIPSVPVGVISANPMVVQTGTKPTLSWDILYPSNVGNVVCIQPPGTLITCTSTYVTVQIVGTSVTTNGSCHSSITNYTEARVSLNGGNYQQLFYGTQEHVDPSKKLFVKKLKAGDTIDFGGRYVENNSWSPFYTTKSGNFQVVALVNGQTPPSSSLVGPSATVNSYLRPYLDASGKVKIGPMSVLILMELVQNDRSHPCYDLQDQVLLVTFSSKHPNNGHGNNLDGVDSSNPGRGSGGPNGAIDPSGGVDDEIR